MTRRIPQGTRTYFFEWLTGHGVERCRMWRDGRAWHIAGSIITTNGPKPAEARYQIACDAQWQTRRVSVTVDMYDAVRGIDIACDNGDWRADGRPVDALRGCVDIDLGWTPATNTLPIRRLDLKVGASSGPVTAAWLRFPELTLEPLPQVYERLAEKQYRYTSRGGEFTALLDVDDNGVVMEYEGYWKRVPPFS